jgi:hypothetical protein
MASSNGEPVAVGPIGGRGMTYHPLVRESRSFSAWRACALTHPNVPSLTPVGGGVLRLSGC